jgi:predicted LPLAT superfamily acyltransferase
MAQNWQQEKEMSNAFWLTLIIKLALKLPRWSVRLLLHPITFFFLLTAPKKRQVSRHYLARALTQKPRIWHVYKHFFCFSSVLLDKVYFLAQKQALFNVSFSNRAEVVQSLEQHPAQFFISGHYGSVEALKACYSSQSYTINPVIKLDHNQTIVNLFKALNPEFYENVIPYNGLETTFKIYETLKGGASIALLADRPIENAPTVSVDFLGDKILLPEGIFEMLLRFPFPANIFFSQYQGGNRYHVHCIPMPIKKEDTPHTLAQHFANILEQQCIDSPYNWFNFYTYWVEPNHDI